MDRKTKRAWRNRLIFVVIVAAAIVGYVWYINSGTIYDFAHLTRTMDFGESREFVPIVEEGQGRVPTMVRAVETPYLSLYISRYDTTFAVHDRRNDAVWHSHPQGPELIANPLHRNIMRSNMGFSFYDESRRRFHRWMYQDAATHGDYQFTIYSIPNGVRIHYIVGNMDIGLHALPRYMEVGLFEERIMSLLADRPADEHFVNQRWRPADELDENQEGEFVRMIDGIFGRPIDEVRMLAIFEEAEWEMYETLHQNSLVGYVPDINFDLFDVVFELVLDGDRMMANVPIEGIQGRDEVYANIFAVDMLRFFGAGCVESEGFILVPSGSGGVINFNNMKYRELGFSLPVYGEDMINVNFFPQMEQAVRMPVLGIQNNGAALVAHVYSGQALATVNANVAGLTAGVGATTSQNHAWFSFQLRTSQPLTMGGLPGVASGDMRVVQENAYTGDLTIMYHFIAGENPGLGEMAQAYQQFLVEQGALTPLAGPGDRTFYLDLLGAVDVQRHILGTPYMTLESMTTMEDAHRFVDMLNAAGITPIQMQLHGWFNRGVNHDVAKQVNVINDVGTAAELRAMNDRLRADGGGLNPVVNFMLTNYYSRNFSRTFEVSRDVAGFLGFMSRVARDVLLTRTSIHRNDWFVLVHPGVIPAHLDDFLPNFERRVGIDGLALADMGDVLSESVYRRNPIDREHSRLLISEQMGRIEAEIPNLVIFGGNDYSFPFASHLVDVPTDTDRFFIIDYEVPFYSMVLHGFIEFAGTATNMRENFSPTNALLNSMTTGAAPRYILTAQPTRNTQFSPHERFYSTHYVNWMEMAIWHYYHFNNVFAPLRGEQMVDFRVLSGRRDDIVIPQQVTVTIFSDGTRIYVNNTYHTFEYYGVIIPPRWFEVVRGA